MFKNKTNNFPSIPQVLNTDMGIYFMVKAREQSKRTLVKRKKKKTIKKRCELQRGYVTNKTLLKSFKNI